MTQEYPHKLDHVLLGDDDAVPPRALHPIFFGSFDWHSCVHGWWTLLTIRRLFPDLPEAERIDAWPTTASPPTRSAAELAYLDRPQSARVRAALWLGVAAGTPREAERHERPQLGRARWSRWRARSPSGFATYLAKLTYPIRSARTSTPRSR